MKNILLITAALLMPLAANAADERKIDFSQVILDQDDKPIVVMECVDPNDTVTTPDGRKECKDTKRVTFTLGLVAMRALNLPEQGIDPTVAQQRGQLALSVYKSTGAELTSEEISTIKKQIAKMYSPIVAVRAAMLLGEPIKK